MVNVYYITEANIRNMIFKREETIKCFHPKVVVEHKRYRRKSLISFDIITVFGTEQKYRYKLYSFFFREFI